MTAPEHRPPDAAPPAVPQAQLPAAPPALAPFQLPVAPPAFMPAALSTTNGLAIAAMVLGIVWVFWIGSILALVFGHVARDQIRRTGQGGDGMAVAGIVLGWVGVGVLSLLVLSYTMAPARY
jgi:hypothetical protein